MALKNESGNYLVVADVKLDRQRVYTKTYKTEDIRVAPTEFDLAVDGVLHCGTLATIMDGFTSTGNLLNDLKTVGYLALKNEPPFNGASGETWTDC